MWRVARKKNSEKTLQSFRGWCDMRGAFCPGARRVETVGRHSNDCMERSPQEFVHFGEQVLARPISLAPLIRMNPRYKLGVWLGVRSNSAECFVETAEGVFRAREVRRLEQQDGWDKKAINNVIGVPWRIVDGKWTVDRPVTQVDPLPPPPVPFEGARVQRERITRTDIEAFRPTAGCPGCNAIRAGKRPQTRSDPSRVRIEECLRTTSKGSERLNRRSEVLNEALVKEGERKHQKKRGSWECSRRIGSTTRVERCADPTCFRFWKDACNESSYSGYEQWQITVGKQPCNGRRVKNGCRGRRERRIQKFDRTEHEAKNRDEHINGGATNG